MKVLTFFNYHLPSSSQKKRTECFVPGQITFQNICCYCVAEIKWFEAEMQ